MSEISLVFPFLPFALGSCLALASPADILRGASRVPSPRGEGTRNAPLRMSAREASLACLPAALVGARHRMWLVANFRPNLIH